MKQVLIIPFIFLVIVACNDSNLKEKMPQQSALADSAVTIDEGSTGSGSTAAASNDTSGNESVTPPQRIAGAYLYCGKYAPASDGKQIYMDCEVLRTSDYTPADARGLWSATINERQSGESVSVVNSEKGIFQVKSESSIMLNATLSRLQISFSGSVDGMDGMLSQSGTNAEKAPAPAAQTAGAAAALVCPSGYAMVPGDTAYGTNAFCVMQYEAKNDGAGVPVSTAAKRPWTNITQPDAQDRCAALGMGYDLINNAEWMTLAVHLSLLAGNWRFGQVGVGELSRGHTDNDPVGSCPASNDPTMAYVQGNCTGTNTGDFSQRRTQFTAAGAAIWDLSGNVWDWTSTVIDNANKPFSNIDAGPVDAFRDYTTINSNFTAISLSLLIPTNATQPQWTESWIISGRYWSGLSGRGGAMARGATWDDFQDAGIFALNLKHDGSYTSEYNGFRCVLRKP